MSKTKLARKETLKEDKSNPIVSKLLGTNPLELNIEKFRENNGPINVNFNCGGRLTKNALKTISGKFTLDTVFKLDIPSQSLTSLSPLEECKNLVYLNIDNNMLLDLKGIEKFENLIYLTADFNTITSLDGIGNCKKLAHLSLIGNNLKSTVLLHDLRIITSLKSLFLMGYKGEGKNPCCEEANYRNTVFDIIKFLRRLDGYGKDVKKLEFQEEVKNVKQTKIGDIKFNYDFWFAKEFPKIDQTKKEIENESSLRDGIKICKDLMEKCEKNLKMVN